MLKVSEFRTWLDSLIEDGQNKLGLTANEIILLLTQKIGEIILAVLIKEKEEKKV